MGSVIIGFIEFLRLIGPVGCFSGLSHCRASL